MSREKVEQLLTYSFNLLKTQNPTKTVFSGAPLSD